MCLYITFAAHSLCLICVLLGAFCIVTLHCFQSRQTFYSPEYEMDFHCVAHQYHCNIIITNAYNKHAHLQHSHFYRVNYFISNKTEKMKQQQQERKINKNKSVNNRKGSNTIFETKTLFEFRKY